MKNFLCALMLCVALVACECSAQDTPPIPPLPGQTVTFEQLMGGLS